MKRSNTPLVIGAGLAALGLFVLATKKAGAAPAADFEVGLTAKVNSVPGVNTRTSPLSTAPKVAANDAFVDTVVQVLQTGIPSTEPAVSREWWKIVTPGGSTGFASAVDAQGNKNLILQ